MRAELARDLPDDCLPAVLARRGFHTIALHGFTSQFYDRATWYPKVGFEESLFAEGLREGGLDRSCGSGFRGLCDADVAERMRQELRASAGGAPQFVYWMTLNSHLPEVSAVTVGSVFDCSQAAPTRALPAICLHARALSAALVDIARVAADPALPPTDFIVVGDHAPPFVRREDRDVFDPDQVPYVRLA